jgi:hypothetical protein
MSIFEEIYTARSDRRVIKFYKNLSIRDRMLMNSQIFRAYFLSFLLFFVLAGQVRGDELLDKAQEYEQVHQQWSSPGYGGVIQHQFTSPDSWETQVLGNQGDSCEHTGLHLGAAALRYAVTRSPQDLELVRRDVETLHVFFRITQTPGFIARYAAEDEWPYNIGHPTNRTVYGSGQWEGSFYINNTSRDMYCGWFFGMSLAHELVDDSDLRATIEEDMVDVITALDAQNWWILGEDGNPTSAAPNPLKYMAANWTLATAVATGDPEIWAIYEDLSAAAVALLPVETFSFFNIYQSYYAFSLSHQSFFGLMRHESDQERLDQYRQWFLKGIHDPVANTHNALFDLMYLGAFDHAEEAEDYQEISADIIKSVTDFPEPPLFKIPIELSEWPLDPFSELMVSLQELLSIDLGFELQSQEPREIADRCHKNFLWHSSPYVLTCTGVNEALLLPGHDYLLAYWLGRYMDIIPPGNPYLDDDDDDANDDVDDDDADDDIDDDADDDANDDADDDAVDDDTGGGVSPDSGPDDDDDDEGSCCG